MVHAEQGPRHPEVFDLMDTDKNGFLSRNEIFQFVHDELEKQGEMNKITTDEENEMISQILEMEGTRLFKKTHSFTCSTSNKGFYGFLWVLTSIDIQLKIAVKDKDKDGVVSRLEFAGVAHSEF